MINRIFKYLPHERGDMFALKLDQGQFKFTDYGFFNPFLQCCPVNSVNTTYEEKIVSL